jgi:4-hydroxy-tetrahydrodipicolinate synthase
MVTPFTADRALDLPGAQRLAAHLVDRGGCDGLVVSGTTGEAPTTSDQEKDQLLRAVVEAVGDRATVIAGAGTYDTHRSVELARAAEKAGAHGLLVVTPYYSKPPQEGLLRHFTTVADATGLPVAVYDIPGRTGTALATPTLISLAEHPRIVAVKDAKDDLAASSKVIAETDLAYYSGTDVLNLPLYAVGGAGVISVIGHVVGNEVRAMLDAFDRGDNATALRLHQQLLPVVHGMMTRAQGATTTKALLRTLGLPAGPVRPPQVDATPDLERTLVEDLRTAGIEVGQAAA